MNRRYIQYSLLGILLLAPYEVMGTKVIEPTHEEYVKTEAGSIDFNFVRSIKSPGIFHKIRQVAVKDSLLELEDGSRWNVSKVDLVQGWDANHLAVTQNHATLSTYRFALLNPDLRLAVPISLVREPRPGKEGYFIKSIDRANDLLTLNDNKRWVIHSSDRSDLSRIKEHDRVLIGINTQKDADTNPYILVDVVHNNYMRANLLD